MHVARVEAVGDQQLGHLGAPLEARAVHGRVAVALADARIRTRRQQRLDRVHLGRAPTVDRAPGVPLDG